MTPNDPNQMITALQGSQVPSIVPQLFSVPPEQLQHLAGDPVLPMAPNSDLMQQRLRQLLYDRSLVRKQGIDVEGENYAPVRNEISHLRSLLRGTK